MSSPTDRSIRIRKDRTDADAAILGAGPAVSRRGFLGGTGGAALAAWGGGLSLAPLLEAKAEGLSLPAALSEGTRASAVLDTLPGKKPLIKLSYRPPNYETPIEYFRTAITPNDAFFVRYHLSNIPEVDAKTWKISVGGDGANGAAEINLDQLKALPAHEVVAVNQCSGNRRGLFAPHVPGVEWGYGAMGCARWKGARLKDVLDKVGLKKEAVEIVFNGADGPPEGRYFAPEFGPDCLAVVSGAGECGPTQISMTGPTLYRFDLSAVKRVPIKGRVNFEFRAEFLNAFNTPWFTPVVGDDDGDFSDPDNFRVTSASGAREIQLVWRINW